MLKFIKTLLKNLRPNVRGQTDRAGLGGPAGLAANAWPQVPCLLILTHQTGPKPPDPLLLLGSCSHRVPQTRPSYSSTAVLGNVRTVPPSSKVSGFGPVAALIWERRFANG